MNEWLLNYVLAMEMKPFSSFQNAEVFFHIRKLGLLHDTELNFICVAKNELESVIHGNQELINAHVEFYNIENAYWRGSETLNGSTFEIYAITFERELQWFFFIMIK
ncbi:MAG: hypothetical protein IPK10_17475 [Bacteroidetes bacterium]|nr:hypothetical protein [Bacteroidota bacterium]